MSKVENLNKKSGQKKYSNGSIMNSSGFTTALTFYKKIFLTRENHKTRFKDFENLILEVMNKQKKNHFG